MQVSSAGPVHGPDSERWFLERGLPSVIGRRGRWRHVLSRSAPVLAGWAVLMVMSFFVMWASGGTDVDTDDDPGTLELLAVVVLFLIVPAVYDFGAFHFLLRNNFLLKKGVLIKTYVL